MLLSLKYLISLIFTRVHRALTYLLNELLILFDTSFIIYRQYIGTVKTNYHEGHEMVPVTISYLVFTHSL